MTLVVGVLCGEEGAVIAADRQVSHGALGVMTVGAPVTKIKIIGKDEALFAFSGSVGLGQQVEGLFDSNYGKLSNMPYLQAVATIQPQLRALLAPPMEMANRAASMMGGNVVQDAICGEILAVKFRDGLSVSNIDIFGTFEQLTPQMPFVCIGSGKQNADPIMRYLWAIYYGEGQTPTLQDGALLAYWTVTVGIKHLKSPGIGFDTDVFVLERAGSGYKASKVEPEQLQLHSNFIDATEAAVRKVRETPTEEPSAPPTLEG